MAGLFLVEKEPQTMAGDWVKVEKATLSKPEVLEISQILGIHPLHAFGLCVRFWIWCDDQISDGNARGVTNVTLDFVIGNAGVTDALVKVGWLIEKNGSIQVPNFDRHLSKCAKNRATTRNRVGNHRGKCNAASVTESLPEKRREEKRREDEEPACAQDGEPDSDSSSSSPQTSKDERPPKFDDVVRFAKAQPMPISEPCVEAFFDEMESVQWTYRGQPCLAKNAWQARFRRWTTNWINNEMRPNGKEMAKR